MRVTLENQDDIPKVRNVGMHETLTIAAAETARLMEELGLLVETCQPPRPEGRGLRLNP